MNTNMKTALTIAICAAAEFAIFTIGYSIGKSRGMNLGYKMASKEMPNAIRGALVDLAEKNELVFVEEEEVDE